MAVARLSVSAAALALVWTYVDTVGYKDDHPSHLQDHHCRQHNHYKNTRYIRAPTSSWRPEGPSGHVARSVNCEKSKTLQEIKQFYEEAQDFQEKAVLGVGLSILGP